MNYNNVQRLKVRYRAVLSYSERQLAQSRKTRHGCDDDDVATLWLVSECFQNMESFMLALRGAGLSLNTN